MLVAQHLKIGPNIHCNIQLGPVSYSETFNKHWITYQETAV